MCMGHSICLFESQKSDGINWNPKSHVSWIEDSINRLIWKYFSLSRELWFLYEHIHMVTSNCVIWSGISYTILTFTIPVPCAVHLSYPLILLHVFLLIFISFIFNLFLDRPRTTLSCIYSRWTFQFHHYSNLSLFSFHFTIIIIIYF